MFSLPAPFEMFIIFYSGKKIILKDIQRTLIVKEGRIILRSEKFKGCQR